MGPGATHEDLVRPGLQTSISSGVSRSTRRAPGDIEPNGNCHETSSHLIPLQWASPRAVHDTPRIALVPVIKLLSLSSKLHASTPHSVTPGGPCPPHVHSDSWVPIRFPLGSA